MKKLTETILSKLSVGDKFFKKEIVNFDKTGSPVFVMVNYKLLSKDLYTSFNVRNIDESRNIMLSRETKIFIL